jgi:hypothetical protein
VYFTAIGFAFMFVEIAFIQKFILFLAHPLYAVAVVLCAFLVFAGMGSRYSRRLQRRDGTSRAGPVALPVAAIVVLALVYLAALPGAFQRLAPMPDAFKIVLAMGLVAPLAFAMGMPFPLGLARLAATTTSLIPWAWGINACASVVAAILAVLLAIHLVLLPSLLACCCTLPRSPLIAERVARRSVASQQAAPPSPGGAASGRRGSKQGSLGVYTGTRRENFVGGTSSSDRHRGPGAHGSAARGQPRASRPRSGARRGLQPRRRRARLGA